MKTTYTNSLWRLKTNKQTNKLTKNQKQNHKKTTGTNNTSLLWLYHATSDLKQLLF